MFSSTIIPTIGREALMNSVNSVLKQDFAAAEFEVIVVNDSGQPLPQADWQRDARVRIISTDRRERSVARNAGAAIARGRYLHFLDDDDILLPGALLAFWKLAQAKPDADWLYGSYRTVDNDGNLVEAFYPELAGNIFAWTVAGESIPFQTSLLLARRFHAVGAFDVDPAIIGVEDREVGRRFALTGQVAFTKDVVAQIRIGEESSTTNWSTRDASDRLGREKALRLDGAIELLFDTDLSSELRYRLGRAFIGSALLNWRSGDRDTARVRVRQALNMVGPGLIDPRFWFTLLTG